MSVRWVWSTVPLLLAAFSLAAGPGPEREQSSGSEDPLALFSKMMPVFTHDRCLNCHGGVDPFSGTTHAGGVIPVSFDYTVRDMGRDSTPECLGCHKEPDWLLAPRHLSFVGKSPLDLCKQMVAFDQGVGGSRLLSHFRHDVLVGIGFAGTAAGPIAPAEPPGMSRAEFLDAAQAWITDGGFACSRWIGTIAVREQAIDGYTRQPFPMAVERFGQRLTRTVDVTLTESGTRAHVVVGGDIDRSTVITASPDCVGTSTTHDVVREDADVPASVSVRIEADGRYSIRLVTDGERTTRTESITHAGCPGLPGEPLEHLEFDWPSWTLTFDGQLPNPADTSRLTGQVPLTRTTWSKEIALEGSRGTDPRVWLLNTIGTPFWSDGTTELTFEFSHRWDLRRPQ